MKLKSLGLSVAVATLLSLGFTGCGSDSDSDEVVEQVSSTTTTDTTVVEPKAVSLSEALVEGTVWREINLEDDNVTERSSNVCYTVQADTVLVSFAEAGELHEGYTNVIEKDGYKIAQYETTPELNDNNLKLLSNGQVVNGDNTFSNIFTNAMDVHKVWTEDGEVVDEGNSKWVLDADCLNNIKPKVDSED